MDKFIEILNSSTVLTAVVSLLVIAFAKTIISIFRLGVTFKSNLASRSELREFEAEMRKDMRGYATQIQKSVTDACMRVIDAKLKDVEGVQETAAEIKVLKAELEAEIKHALEKYDEIKSIGDSVRSLSNKVTRMEYKDSTSNTARRTEK